jgi:hypothetical protein
MKQLCKFLFLSVAAMGLLGSAAVAEEIMGRCVAIDKEKNTITIIKDAANDKANPNFQLPPATFDLPAGAEPARRAGAEPARVGGIALAAGGDP